MREALGVFLTAARERNEAADHALLVGPPGLGKTTLAGILAHELGVQVTHTSGPVIERPADLAGLLTNLQERDVLFIDEIHRLNPVVEEYLYPAMEDFALDILLDRGPSARSVRLNLPKFTLVGATTRAGLITSPLRARFGLSSGWIYGSRTSSASCAARQAIGRRHRCRRARARAARAHAARGEPPAAPRARLRAGANEASSTRPRSGALRLLDVDERGLDDMDRRLLPLIRNTTAPGRPRHARVVVAKKPRRSRTCTTVPHQEGF